MLDHATGRFRVVPFHVVGVVQEFPSAPKDSFMVANLRYLSGADHAGGPNLVFAKAGGDPRAVARRVAASTRSEGTVVKDIREQTAQTVSSITTVDLTGISHIEEAFAIALAAGAMALFVALAIAEGRHELATMAALGAPSREIGAFVWSEAALVLGPGWSSPPGSAGSCQRCSSPCSSTSSIPHPTTWRFRGASCWGWAERRSSRRSWRPPWQVGACAIFP